MDMTPILHAEHLNKQVSSGDRQLTILSDLALSVFPGETVAILGQSGAGKSTLLGLLAGLDLPTDGTLSMFGETLAELDEDSRARLRAGRVGFVFQNFQLLPTLTALENVMLPLELSPRPGTEALAKEWLTRVGLGERLDHLPKQLSGGEQQRVALARAFVTGAELVFADEPTGNLDLDNAERVIALLDGLCRESGRTLIMATHAREVVGLADQLLTIRDGRLVDAGAAA